MSHLPLAGCKIYIYFYFACFSFFGGDYHNAIGSACSINRRGVSVLKNVYLLNILHIKGIEYIGIAIHPLNIRI
ncbi:hypothetical protein D3C78_1371690 [compost metagenome]